MRLAARGSLFFVSAILIGCGTTAPPSSLERALSTLRERPAWLFPNGECPADVASAAEQEPRSLRDQCVSDLASCVGQCQANDASACYFGALRVQELRSDDDAAEALFVRACRLGISSGCTNRAAGMLHRSPDDPASRSCAVRTFERTCQADDPWGCAMLGFHLIKGLGVGKDLARAERVLKKACSRYGERDPACARAQELLEQLGAPKATPDT